MARKKSPAQILHSDEELGSVLFVLFIPSKTKDGDDLPDGEDQQLWAEAVGDVLAEELSFLQAIERKLVEERHPVFNIPRSAA